MNGEDGASSPSTKISSKLSYGEMFKFNKNGNKATALDQPAAEQPPGASKEQQKSSRRTTSLLNLFMSNSQGKQHIYIQSRRWHSNLFFISQFLSVFNFHSPSAFTKPHLSVALT